MKEQSFIRTRSVGSHSAVGTDHCDHLERICWAVAQQISVLEILSARWVGSVEKWGCSSRAGSRQLFAPALLRVRSGCSVSLPVTSSLCPCWGWCWAWHSKFPVSINSGACPVKAVRIWWTLWKNKCWLCVFSFFISAYHMAVRDTATSCVGKVSLEIRSKWEEGITKSILFL